MITFPVVELFTSINGEGVLAGQLAVFVRFQGCNLNCSYCDTQWANQADAPFTPMTAEQIRDAILAANIRLVTLTGGEPLCQPQLRELLLLLSQDTTLHMEIETNGSMDLTPLLNIPNVTFTMDYKLAGSAMESHMRLSNFALLRPQDTVKFVVSSPDDLQRAREIISHYELTERCHVYLSPVFGKIDPADIVAYMTEHTMNRVTLQLQMHKVIWNPNARGV